jgi:hypothetical protein
MSRQKPAAADLDGKSAAALATAIPNRDEPGLGRSVGQGPGLTVRQGQRDAALQKILFALLPRGTVLREHLNGKLLAGGASFVFGC